MLPSSAPAQKLDDDDKRFLKDVRLLILPDEKAVFKKLKDKADRLVFQEIFWARRDPNLATPENEFQEQYVKDRAMADRAYARGGDRLPGVPGGSGSATDCGRLFILFGEPDEIETFPSYPISSPGPLRDPLGRPAPLAYRSEVVWVYKDQPGRRLDVARLEIPLRHCHGGPRVNVLVERMAAMKIVHPNIDYRVDEDGHLVRPADQLAGHTPSCDSLTPCSIDGRSRPRQRREVAEGERC